MAKNTQPGAASTPKLNLKERLFNKEAAARARAVPESAATFDPAEMRRIASTAPFKGLAALTGDSI